MRVWGFDFYLELSAFFRGFFPKPEHKVKQPHMNLWAVISFQKFRHKTSQIYQPFFALQQAQRHPTLATERKTFCHSIFAFPAVAWCLLVKSPNAVKNKTTKNYLKFEPENKGNHKYYLKPKKSAK